jgi:hypothetical protein
MKEPTNLDALKLNTHSIYHSDNNRILCALNLLLFAETQFQSSFLIQNLATLKLISENCSLGKPPKKEIVSDFVDNGLIDAIKISICFENYSKAILLAKGYLIHNIDRNKFKDEAKKQKKSPVLIEDFHCEFYDDTTIQSDNPKLRKKINGLKDTTEQYSIILKNKSYLDIIMLEEHLAKTLIDLNKARNALHLQFSLSFNMSSTTYDEFKVLKEFVDVKIKERKKYLTDYLFGEGNTKKPIFEIKST